MRIDTEYYRALSERDREQKVRNERHRREQRRLCVFQAVLGIFYIIAGVESFAQDYDDMALKAHRVEGGTLDERISTAASDSFYLPSILTPM